MGVKMISYGNNVFAIQDQWLALFEAFLTVPTGIYDEDKIDEPIFLTIDRDKTSPSSRKIYVKPADGSLHPVGVLTFPLAREKFKNGDKVMVGYGGTGKVKSNEDLIWGDLVKADANGYATRIIDASYSNYVVKSYYSNFNMAIIGAAHGIS